MGKKLSTPSEGDVKYGYVTIEGLRCGSCVHFKGVPYFSTPCNERGKKVRSMPCSAFELRPELIDFEDSVTFKLISLLKKATPDQLNQIAGLAAQEIKTRKYNFKYGDIVWIRMFGGDFLQNYGKARVVRATKEYVFVRGVDDHNFSAQVYHDSVLTEEEYDAKKSKLLKLGKIIDLEYKKYLTPKPLKQRIISGKVRIEDAKETNTNRVRISRKVSKAKETSLVTKVRG